MTQQSLLSEKPKIIFFKYALLSQILWGVVPILFKSLQAFNHFEIIFYRILFSAFFLIPYLFFRKVDTFLNLKKLYCASRLHFFQMIGLNALGSILLITNWVSYVYVVNSVNVHTAAVGYLILPVYTAVLAFLILKEKLNVFQWIAVGLSCLSCYLLNHVNSHEMGYVIAIGLSYAFYLITQSKNIYTTRFFNLAFQMSLGVLIMFFISPQNSISLHFETTFWIYLPIIALMFTILPLWLNMTALNGLTTSTLSFLGYITPIIVFLIGICFYGEKVDVTMIVSYSILAFALMIFNFNALRAMFVSNYAHK